MKIRNISLYSLSAPLHTPFKTALRTVNALHDSVVVLQCDNGIVGFGSAPATLAITQQDHRHIANDIHKLLKPLLIGQTLEQFDTIIRQVNQHPEAGSNAKAAIDVALYDAFAQLNQMPLYQLLSPAQQPSKTIHTTLMTDYTISVNSPEQMQKHVDEAISRGYRCLKVKVGKEPKDDIDSITQLYHHIRRSCTEEIAIRIDANQGWSTDSAISIMQTLETNGMTFELLEQPVKANDITGMATIKAAINTPLMADESAFNLSQVKQLHRCEAADIINIKLIKTGGLFGALSIIEYCRQHDITCMIGCMLESSIGVAAASHLAAANADVIKLIDLDGPTLAKFDPIKGATVFDNANIQLNTTAGLGISPNQSFDPWRAE
ncbi:dipeptide epimerase [Glaciecola sp. XM2]|uniref:mandelate racemase/muconate lactonizing enzyme family protein n=1 Tax=Glaciecola sp. XM2 TaxID=1914931 RepID=UPI001BDDDEBF|nr:dipeptide epimerase [Glaciecola sp. XM2]MBT1452236.1 dipeptide epimerase [Glaciecola sp. XM2]